MTMMQKMQAKKSKKGFTLVELVIVIAILAILAAIAIPVITTTINSSKTSTMQSDTATVNMLLKEAINTSKASISTTKYGPDSDVAKDATVFDVLYSNDIGMNADATAVKGDFFDRFIGGTEYVMVFNETTKNIEMVAADDQTEDQKTLADDTTIAELDPEGGADAEGE